MFELDPELSRAFLSLGYAIIAGIFYALVGYFKRKEPGETFDGETFIFSVVVGLISGFIAFYLNITPQEALAMILAETGLLYYIENITKSIYRRWILPWLESLKRATP